METRKITVFSTQGAQKKEFQSSAQTWGEFSSEIANQYSLSSLAATENINRTDLVNAQAVLPTGDFTIFLRPVKTKSGAGLSFKEARAKLTDADKAWIKDNLHKNWTNATTEELNTVLNRGDKKSSSKTSSKTSAKEVADVKEAVPTQKSDNSGVYLNLLSAIKDSTQNIRNLMGEDMEDYDLEDSVALIEQSVFDLSQALGLVMEEPEKQEKKETEEERLAKEWDEISRGFKR